MIAHLTDAEKQQRHKLEQPNRKLLQHSIVLEQLTISQERNQLAHELHDTLAHTLSGTTVQDFGGWKDARMVRHYVRQLDVSNSDFTAGMYDE